MKILNTLVVSFLAAFSAPVATPQSRYSPPSGSATVLEGIRFQNAALLDESYRAEFERCDKHDKFEGQEMTGLRRCGDDKNRVKALLRFPDGTLLFESKLSLDVDGSWKACHNPGSADQCSTWFKWKKQPRVKENVDPDKFPFVVIPAVALNGREDREFRNKTGINKGDLGVVIYKDRVVPVFVADSGPHNKLGEGSGALLRALGEDRCLSWTKGHCERYHDVSIPSGVLVFLFPNSKLDNFNPDNALARIRAEALRRFKQLRIY